MDQLDDQQERMDQDMTNENNGEDKREETDHTQQKESTQCEDKEKESEVCGDNDCQSDDKENQQRDSPRICVSSEYANPCDTDEMNTEATDRNDTGTSSQEYDESLIREQMKDPSLKEQCANIIKEWNKAKDSPMVLSEDEGRGLDNFKCDWQKLVDENEELKKEIQNIQEREIEKSEEHQKTIEEMKNREIEKSENHDRIIEEMKKRLVDENEELKKEIQIIQEREIEKSEKQERTIEEMETREIEKSENHDRIIEEMKKRSTENYQQLEKEKEREIDNLKKEIDRQCQSKDHGLQSAMQEADTLRLSKDHGLQSAMQEADTLRLRLSKIAGAKMIEGNPNIADLSDPNRPTKLAEKYKELYDNEWTDAFEILTVGQTNYDKKSSIQILRKILTKCYKECVKHSDDQWKRFASDLTLTQSEHTDETLKDIGFQETEVKKDLKSIRRMASNVSAKCIVEKVKTTLKDDHDDTLLQELDTYIEACTRLSWEMALQDPPLHMFWDLKKDDPPNDMFKPYTQSGTKVSYVVWPCLLRQEGGDLLTKGVYQLYK